MLQASSRLIAHAGGRIAELKYTNSQEAILASSLHTDLIEVDIVPARDGLIVAHDGLEKSYGFSQPFSEISVAEFSASKYRNRYTALSLSDLCELCSRLGSRFILDIKPSGDEYASCLREVAHLSDKYGVRDRFIIQAYDLPDMKTLRGMGFHGVMIALWKNYGKVRADESKAFVDRCLAMNEGSFCGLSLPYKRMLNGRGEFDPEVLRPYLERIENVFLHGHQPDSEPALLSLGVGLFTHDVEAAGSHLR